VVESDAAAGDRHRGFPPLARDDARILILGSMPSRESLARQRYYAHPRNAFWPILADLLDIGAADYATRAARVLDRGIAIWDVLGECIRPGSLDSAIDESSAVVNDFPSFFRRHTGLRRIFFNGAKAESLFVRRVLPGLDAAAASLPRVRLPSTSPAHAGMRPAEKREAWRLILEDALE
jgi:hypoxanthine-DNA glycosylase